MANRGLQAVLMAAAEEAGRDDANTLLIIENVRAALDAAEMEAAEAAGVRPHDERADDDYREMTELGEVL